MIKVIPLLLKGSQIFFAVFALLILNGRQVFSFGMDSLKVLTAIRTNEPPQIDGTLAEIEWLNAPSATGYTQDSPQYGKPSRFSSQVKVLYDNQNLYVGAILFDPSPDSILHQLGNRDEGNLNADLFQISFDTYANRQDAFTFGVNAAGVQYDRRVADPTYDAVWHSAVKIDAKGWSVEIKIPYSAIRFPDLNEQAWNLQISRYVRRIREEAFWSFIRREEINPLVCWGKLEGLKGIVSPPRLSLSPYLAGYWESVPGTRADGSNFVDQSYSANYGADFKLGLDDRFTLDMTLLPDFSQVQSDNKVKNLSYAEVIFQENRPFFKEGTELFGKDNLFYSRRIGRTPARFNAVEGSLKPGEKIEDNPSETPLINATKVSGRNNHNLGIGILNALTGKTTASIRETTGQVRKIETEPFSNYNVLVLDQRFGNSSSAYLINTNVTRDGNWKDANVTGGGLDWLDKKNVVKVSGSGALSQQLTGGTDQQNLASSTGYKFSAGVEKVKGKVKFGLNHSGVDHQYAQNDFGFFQVNDYLNHIAYFRVNQFEPGKLLLFSNFETTVKLAQNYQTGKQTGFSVGAEYFAVTVRQLAFFWGGEISPIKNLDFYEGRIPGRIYRTRKYYFAYFGVSTDYRKTFAVDPQVEYANFMGENLPAPMLGGKVAMRFRVSDKMMAFYTIRASDDKYNEGFTTFDSTGNSIFGGRRLINYENILQVKYHFKNDLSLSLRGRHYWRTGEYSKYFNLNEDGSLSEIKPYWGNENFSYNAFNIDLVFDWLFAPGSRMTLTYKNFIETDKNILVRPRFDDNFEQTMGSAQSNSFSLKAMYFLDYLYLRKNKPKV